MKKIIYGLALLLSITVLYGKTEAAAKDKKIDVTFLRTDSFTLTNAGGKKLTYQNGKITGNMKVYQDVRWGMKKRILTIDMSTEFKYVTQKKKVDIDFSDNKWFSSVIAENVDSIIVKYNNNSSYIKVYGKNIPVRIDTDSVLDDDFLIDIDGRGTNVEMKNSKRGIELSNLKGTFSYENDDLKFNKNSRKSFRLLPTKNKIRIKNPVSRNLKVTGAILYSKKISKKVEGIHVIPVSKTSQALSFNKVKKAKGYVIYRLKENGETEQAAVLKGQDSTVWVDKKIPEGERRAYVIAFYTEKDGKKIYAKNSYEVSGVAYSKKKGNATKVSLNKTGRIKLKVGKSVKLKAKVKGEKGKKLLSRKVRWYSKKKSVAIVTAKGKVTALKKGTCKIYAKAHNGENSKSVTIRV